MLHKSNQCYEELAVFIKKNSDFVIPNVWIRSVRKRSNLAKWAFDIFFYSNKFHWKDVEFPLNEERTGKKTL